MAERRMFSKKIIDSARFLKMPLETQTLYFHLGLRADDDGVVEAYSVMRIVGANEDSLRILMAKNFVTVLNDDLVTHITDWSEHNLIRSDRKIDSIYKDLLLRIIPDVELIEPKERADKKHKGQPMDVQRTTNGLLRIGEDRLGKGSVVEDSIDVEPEAKFSFKLIRAKQYDSLSRVYKENLVAYAQERKSEHLLEQLINYSQREGKPYKDWSAALRTFENNEKKFSRGSNTQAAVSAANLSRFGLGN